MSACAIPVLGAITALVVAIGGVVTAYSKALEAEAKLERALALSRRRDAAIVSALNLRPTKDGVTLTMRGGAPAMPGDTEILDRIARKGGFE
jgi:hypothetical protein